MSPVIENRKIRIAIIACGRIPRNHFNWIEKHAYNIKLAAICEANLQ